MLMQGDKENEDLNENLLVKLVKKIFPIQNQLDGEKFFVKKDGRTVATPLLLVLVIIEASDVIFAVDSIPAVMAVTTDPFIVFTSNIFAILGLRSLYFALSAIMREFKYLKYSIIVLLGYVGVKMLLAHVYPIPTLFSLGFIFAALAAGVVASKLSKD
jgi:tellurite resistance protein TerC